MARRSLISLAAIVITLIYRFALDANTAFHILLYFSDTGHVSASDMRNLKALFYVLLAVGLICLVAFQYEKLVGMSIYAYFASLLTSFLVPFRSHGFMSMGRVFDGIVTVVMNVLVGPAMIMMLSYLLVKIIKRKLHRRIRT